LSPDLARILALPRNELPPLDLVVRLSEHLRKPGSSALLRPQQVQLIRDALELRGAVAHMPVGSGKTLPTLLLPTILNAQKPMLMLPATLRDKTQRDFAEYALDWKVRLPELVSYEEMCRKDREHKLTTDRPDLLMADECDPLHRDNAVARRVDRYVKTADPRPIYIELSGTYITEHIADYAAPTVRVLGAGAPVPLAPSEQERWANAIDNQIQTLVRVPGPELPGGFHEWYRTTRGVVCGRGVECSSSIRASTFSPPLPPTLEQTIKIVRATGRRPDGEVLSEWELPDVTCQIALGFYYVWDPLPPKWWIRPRRAWHSYVRAVKDERLPTFDTEKCITDALDARNPHALPPESNEARELLARWRAVKDEYEPNPVPVWIDPTPVHQVAARARAVANGRGTLIWCEHTTALAPAFESLGIPYYAGGRDPELATPGQLIAVSIEAHHRGKNLQFHWHRNLITKPMASQKRAEQLIGRTHRSLQKNPHVDVEFLATIEYHHEVLARVLAKARAVSKSTKVDHKLVLADWI
jgi:hypothetical protein